MTGFQSPLTPFLAHQRFAVLDGGLATELERRGHDLKDPLWSARLLVEQPDAIRAVHLDYFRAGADIAISASYQASFKGLAARGLSGPKAEAVFTRSVTLAREARDQFQSESDDPCRLPPLVAASIGPYGAALGDGSEYTGAYRVTDRQLRDFHAVRLDVLAAAGPDLLACETIPSRQEAEVLADLLEQRAGLPAWFAFTGKDATRVADGTPFAELVRSIGQARSVVALGLNCTPPQLMAPLLESAGDSGEKPFVVYPNAGSSWDAKTKQWSGEEAGESIPRLVDRWCDLGARVIGGCCRTTPDTIRGIRERLH
jgi:homocysteine S-methyltransferase